MNFYLFNEDTGVSITIGLIDKITSASIKCKYQVQVSSASSKLRADRDDTRFITAFQNTLSFRAKRLS